MPTLISPLASAAATFIGTLGALALKAALLLGLAWIATRFMRRTSAALRHSVWTAAIGGAILLPLLALGLPELRTVIPGARAFQDLAARFSAPLPPTNGIEVRDVTPSAAPTAAVSPNVAGDTGHPVMVTAAAAAASAGPVDVRRQAEPTALPFGATLILIWVAGTTLALIPMALGIAHLRRITSRVRDVESDALDDYAARLARTLGVRRVVRVVEGEAGATPMTWGVFRPVVMVPGGFSEWPEEQQRDVLLHELAHVARYDCLTQHLARFACALYWFNPLAWVAATRLRIERERACDDRVLLAGARPSAYADHLLTIARTLRGPGMASAAALAMARPSHLEGRLLALLDAGRRRGTVTRRAAATVAAAVLMVAALLAMVAPGAARTANAAELDAGPAFPPVAVTPSDDTIPPKATEPPSTESTTTTTTERSTSNSRSGSETKGGHEVGTTVDGKPGFTIPWCSTMNSNSSSSQVWTDDDENHLRARIKLGSCVVQLEMEGEVTYNEEFTDVVAISRDGWFEVYDRGGPSTHKLRIVPASNGTLTRTWTVDGEVRPYDEEARRWLRATLDILDQNTDFSKGARINAAYKSKGPNGVIDLVSTSKSDHSKRVGVGRLLKLARLDEAQVGRIIDLAKTSMSSDYEQAELLRALLAEKLVTPALQTRFIEAASAMSSDYERSRTLKAIVNEGALTVAAQKAVYEVAARISSDYERGQLMKAVTKQYGLGGETWRSFVDAASRFSSDYELRTMLSAAVNEYPKLPDATIQAVLDLVKTKVDSDYEKAEFFITVARARPATEAEHERIAKAAESISSEYEYGRVLSALRKRRVSSGNL